MSQKKVRIFIKGKDRTKDIKSWEKSSSKISVTFINDKTYLYNLDNVQIEYSSLSDTNSLNCFNYLKSIAQNTSLQDESSGNILLKQYEKIDFLSKQSIFSAFLSSNLEKNTISQLSKTIMYPFSFNLSQKTAIDNALKNSLSIIEGPPGTGKTQTILNIIANIVMNNQTVAVVSSNNSATNNVFEKLKKYNLDFISAPLGSFDNKQKFIGSQSLIPDLSNLELSSTQEHEIKQALQYLHNKLKKILANQNTLSKLKQELSYLEIEYKHFKKYCTYTNNDVLKYLKPINSDISLELWILCEKYIRQNKIPNFFIRLINRFFRGVKNKDFYSLSGEIMIMFCQKNYYEIKIKELSLLIKTIQKELESFNFNQKMEDYSALSLQLFNNTISKKYKNINNKQFTTEDLYYNSQEFINRYPVILSTTYSLRNSLSNSIMYDYVIIDEASQVDIVTGSLALSCAKKAVVVGDLKQLPNVVNSKVEKITDNIFKQYNLPESYRYKDNNLLSLSLKLFPDSPKTLLREHYRCHPQIINFCNKKFYNDELIILTKPSSDRQPLMVYQTTPGNHARDNVNQRQIDVIQHEIIPQQNLQDNALSIGIVTPYRNHTNTLQKVFKETKIQADTVDKFQGRENNIIILSTVDNIISPFTDNPNRLNVAVSRAIDQLIVVINGNEESHNTNIGDLINYIKYNNLQIINSEIYSIFDYLYKNYNEKRIKFLNKKRRYKISKYDSENLMYILICDVLKEDKFAKFDVMAHVPLKMILRDTKKLTDDEKKYACNILTHVDFLIFDKLGKLPLLGIEVDGVAYHSKGSIQEKRDNLKNNILNKYNIPLIRFKTNGSNERNELSSKLNEIIK